MSRNSNSKPVILNDVKSNISHTHNTIVEFPKKYLFQIFIIISNLIKIQIHIHLELPN